MRIKRKITSLGLGCWVVISCLFSSLGASSALANEEQNTHKNTAALNKYKEFKGKNNNINLKNQPYIDGEVLVKFKKRTNKTSLLKKHNYKVKEELPSGITLIEVPKTEQTSSFIKTLSDDANIEIVQPNYLYHPSSIFNDPYSNELWGLHNTGQYINEIRGKSDVDINLPEAWNLIKEKPLNEIIVAVIDSGVQTTHPDLAEHIWTNEAEANGIAGVDDDGNGYIDDLNGYDFFNNDNTVYDEIDGDEHGTHVAGTISATTNNNIGVAGIAPNVKIMPLKFLGPEGGSTFGAIQAINYAKEKGVKISNNSWGGYGDDWFLKETIESSEMLFIAAAGNYGKNNDSLPYYPASYNSSNILSVSAVDSKGNKASFSNYGRTSVDIAAPGVDILSTVPFQTPSFGAAAEIIGPNYKAIFNGFGFENMINFIKRKDAFQKALQFLDATTNSNILLVQDDESDTIHQSYLSIYEELLSDLGYQYQVKTVATNTDGPNLTGFDIVIWFTGDAYGEWPTPTLTENDLSSLDTYLKNGGKLILSGQDAIWWNEYSDLVTQTLGIQFFHEGLPLPSTVMGESGTIYNGEEYEISQVMFADLIDANADSPLGVHTAVNLSYPEFPIGYPQYEYFDGTSMAAPHVTGAVALAMGVNDKFTPEQLIDLTKKTGKTVTGASMTTSKKMVDAKKLIESISPVKLEINELFDSSPYIKGSSDPGAKVTVKDINNKTITSGTADKAGNFNLKLKSKQTADTKFFVRAELGLRTSEQITLIVKQDTVKPELVGKLIATNVSTFAEGIVTEEASIKITISGKTYVGKTDVNGKFKISIGKQAEGTTGVIELTDNAAPANITTINFTIKDGIAPVIKKVNPIYNTSNYIEGEVSESAAIDIFTSPDNKTWSKLNAEPITTDSNNKFKFELLEKLASTTKVKIVATDKDENISKDSLSTVVPDKKAPVIVEPAILEIDDSGEKTIAAKLDEAGTVEVKVNGNSVGDAIITEKDGSFTVTIPKLLPNAKVTFILTDTIGNKTEKTYIAKDATKPIIIQDSIFDVFNTSKLIKGKVSERATVTAAVNGKVISTATTDAEGNFSLTLRNRLATNTNVELKAKDFAKPKGLESDNVTIVIKDDTINPELISISIADNSTTVTGKVSEEAKVQLKVGETALNRTPVSTDALGNFKISIPKQKAGTYVTILITDFAENKIEQNVFVEDKTAPVVVKLEPFYHGTSSFLTGSVNEASTINIYIIGRNGKIEEPVFISGATDSDGKFSIQVEEVLAIGSKLGIIAEDESGNKSATKVITVLKDTAAPTLKVNSIYNDTVVIEGTLNEKGTVTVLVGSEEIATVDTNENNEFSINLNGPLAGRTKVTFICEDTVGNKRTYTQYVKTSAAPVPSAY
ncbi:S8 family serine peptidase [Bacillus sp. JJ1773]|uniref:S8 family serine peptidase n=1 Tax=Bacillus sp. JJ1773 TaxID=3122965 RepID=UPI002FFF5F4E